MENPIHIQGENEHSLGYVQSSTTGDSYRSFRVRTCKQCKFSTTSAKEFLQHQITAHTESETHACSKCDFETTRYLDLVAHIRLEHRPTGGSGRNRTASMDNYTGIIAEDNNNEKIFARDKAPSPMLPPGDFNEYHSNGRHSPDVPGDAIEVFECGLCSFATTKESDLKAHQIKHKINTKGLLDDIYKAPQQNRSGGQQEMDSDFAIMQRSYLSQNGGNEHLYMGNEDEEDNRLIIDENLPKTMVVSTPSMPPMTIARPVPVYSTSPVVHQRAKPGPKPGTTGSANRPRTGCAPVREAVDPAKYISIQEPDGIKYACSKCGNIYKWRKSLNKHWKEKHDGEIPDPRPNLTALNIPRLGKGYVTGLPNGKGNVISFMSPQQQQHNQRPPSNKPASGPLGPGLMSGGDMSMNSTEIRKVLKRPAMAEAFTVGGSPKGVGLPQSTMTKGGPMPKYNSTGSLHGMSLLQPNKMSRMSDDGSLPRYVPGNMSPSSFRSPENKSSTNSTAPSPRSYHRREAPPVDLTKQPVSFTSVRTPKPAHGEGILDLSRKIPGSFHSNKRIPNLEKLPLQDEPLDFSMKPKSEAKSDPEAFGYVNEEIGSLMSMQCPSCAYSAHNKQDYDNHMELHLRKQHFKCAECQEVYGTMAMLNEHFITVHLHSDIVQQKLSGRDGAGKQSSTVESTQLYKYLTMESKSQLLSCMVCGAIFQWQWTLANHFEKDHHMLPNPYKKKASTSSCASSAMRPVSVSPSLSGDDAVVDMKPCEDGDMIQCNQCPFQCISNSELTRHQLKHSISRQYICRICSFMTRWKDQLLSHYKQDHPTSTVDLNSITSHTVTGPILQSEPSTPPNSKPYIDLTDEETTIVYPQAPEDTDYDNPDAHDTRSSKRRSAGEDSPGGSASTEIMLPFKCTVCEYRARWPSEITQHMKNHSDQKPYHCPRCSYRSKWKWDVVKHLKRCGGGTVNDVIDTTKQAKSHNIHALFNEGSAKGQNHSASLVQRELLSNGPPNVTVLPPGKQSDKMESTRSSEYDFHNISCTSDGSRSPVSEKSRTVDGGSSTTEQNAQAYHVCLHCPFIGNSPAELKRHSRVHSDEKPFICKTCGYCSKWKCDLKKHLRTYKHTSAVPLTYGGHGRKPADWNEQKYSDGEDNNSDADGNDGVYKSMDTDGSPEKMEQPLLYKCDKCQYVTYKKHFIDSHMKIHRTTSAQNQAAKLKCKQCEFEATDLPSFLQHKLSHSQSEVKSESLREMESEQGVTDYSPITKHRRKASKQNRITRHETDDMEAADEEDGTSINGGRMDDDSSPIDFSSKVLPASTVSPIEHEGKALLMSSTNTHQCPHCQYNTDNKNSYDKHVKLHNSHNKYVCEWCNWSIDRLNLLYRHAQAAHPAELALQEKPSLYGKTQGKEDGEDADMKYDTEDEDAPGGNRRMSWSRRQDMSNIEKRRLEVRRENQGGMEDDLPPELRSKRRRRLKTCTKCGYITDNVTTLQRHMAKHGSNGKFTCDFCDYSVDRQHIVEYHIKIVHNIAMNGDADGQSEGPAEDTAGDEDMPDMDKNMEVDDYFDDGDSKNHEAIWEITKIKGREMKVQRIGRKTTYHCLKCPFYTCNITNAANHMKQHGVSKKYTCELCDYSLDQLRHVMHHMKKVHGHDADISFSDNGEEVDDSFNDTYDMDITREHYAQPDLSETADPTDQHAGKIILTVKKNFISNAGPTKRKSQTRYPCSKCAFVAYGAAALRSHVAVHKRFRNKFQCQRCDYKATTSRLLLTHINQQHAK